MKLYLTATSERGKPVTKSGNDFIQMIVIDEQRKELARIMISPGDRVNMPYLTVYLAGKGIHDYAKHIPI